MFEYQNRKPSNPLGQAHQGMMQNYIASDMNSDYSASDDEEDGKWDSEKVYNRKN